MCNMASSVDNESPNHAQNSVVGFERNIPQNVTQYVTGGTKRLLRALSPPSFGSKDPVGASAMTLTHCRVD